MTPKEKASELIDKFTYWNTSEAEREGIKSALSAVADILSIRKLKDVESQNYWQEVRNEINKL